MWPPIWVRNCHCWSAASTTINSSRRRQPSSCRDLDAFVAEVQEWLTDVRPVNAKDAVDAVFATLSRHLPEGQLVIVRNSLPGSIRDRWASLEVVVTPPPAQGDPPAAAWRGH